MKTVLLAVCLAFVPLVLGADASLYDRARELYKQGPAKGAEVVQLLREHIKAQPEDMDAISLLGITLFGIGRSEEALPAINRYIELADQKKQIRPKMLMLKARTLYELKRNWECKRVLEAFWAFWQDSPELKKAYEWYYPRVENATKPEERANQSQQRNAGRWPSSDDSPASASLFVNRPAWHILIDPAK